MLRVCHMITHLEMGGAQLNTLHTVANLNRSRFAVSLVTGPHGALRPRLSDLPADISIHVVDELVRPVDPRRDVVAFGRLCSLLREIRPDIVHTHTSKAGILGRWAAFVTGVPGRVHTFHGLGLHEQDRAWRFHSFVAAARSAVPLTSRFVVVAEENRRRGERMGVLDPARTTLIRSGIDLEPFRELRSAALQGGEERVRLRHRARGRFGIPHDTSVVTMVAGLRPQKAPVDFVEVAARVNRRTETPVRFRLVGDGELRANVERRCRELDLEGRVEVLGFRDDVPELLAATDIAVLTSRWEGLPRVVPEAMAAGLPVVANDVCGVSEAVREGESGWLIRPGDLDGMADRVVALLEDPSRAAAMGSHAASLCEEFDIRRMMRSQEELYERLGARRG